MSEAFENWSRGFRCAVEQYFDGAITGCELARYALSSVNVDGYLKYRSRLYMFRIWLAWKILPRL